MRVMHNDKGSVSSLTLTPDELATIYESLIDRAFRLAAFDTPEWTARAREIRELAARILRELE